MILSVYGDESSDETRQRVFAIAGVIGSEDLWTALEGKWMARCGSIPFHANDCDSDKGDFSKFTHEDNKDRYRDFAVLLAESGLGGFGIALNLIGQKMVFPEAPGGMAFYKCFVEVIQKMKNCAAFNRATVKFTFDKRPESEHNTNVLYAMAKQTKQWEPFLDSEISFQCSKEHPRIQAADLFARETMKALDNRIGPKERKPRKAWLCLEETQRFHIDIYEKEWFEDLKAQMPALEKSTNMSMEDYALWLTSTKRIVDNISNRFEYIRYVVARDGE